MEANCTQKCVAEFIGTFGIVFFGCGSVVIGGESLGLVGVALAFGLIVGTMVASLGHISGAHINPAVTFMALITGRMKLPMAAAYVVAQLLGGVAGAGALEAVADPANWEKVHGATTTLSVGVSAGLMTEFILTFFLVLVIFGAAIDPRGSKLGPAAIGAVVTLDILLGGPVTGASMNPARTFGPALLSGTWEHHWVYWVGPLLGSAAAAIVYEKAMMPPESKT
jgi:MIP family channel proteins